MSLEYVPAEAHSSTPKAVRSTASPYLRYRLIAARAEQRPSPHWLDARGFAARLRVTGLSRNHEAARRLYWKLRRSVDFVAGLAPVSVHRTLGGLTQFRPPPPARKPLILKHGEMLEWLKKHAWKAISASDTEPLQGTSTQPDWSHVTSTNDPRPFRKGHRLPSNSHPQCRPTSGTSSAREDDRVPFLALASYVLSYSWMRHSLNTHAN
jgi:hypothetical protein